MNYIDEKCIDDICSVDKIIDDFYLYNKDVSDRISQRVFICGCGHSGTSLMLAMLSNNSHIYGINKETNLFIEISLQNIHKYLLHEIQALKYKKSILLEKTPKHVYALDFLLHAMPRSKCIVMLRNPLDVVASLTKRYHNLGISMERYMNDNYAALPYLSHENLLSMKYEDFMSDTKSHLEGICQFLSIPCEDTMLHYHESDTDYFGAQDRAYTGGLDGSDHVALRNWQLHQPVSNRSGEWKERMTPEVYALVKKATRPIAARLGYTYQEDYLNPDIPFASQWK